MVKVQWYPGHMEKARREMNERLKSVDMIIEVCDARIPEASRNPMLASMALQKPRLIIIFLWQAQRQSNWGMKSIPISKSV